MLKYYLKINNILIPAYLPFKYVGVPKITTHTKDNYPFNYETTLSDDDASPTIT